MIHSSIRKTKSLQIDKSMTVSGVISGIFDDMIDPLSKLVEWIQRSLIK